jgi:hypothetical protein
MLLFHRIISAVLILFTAFSLLSVTRQNVFAQNIDVNQALDEVTKASGCGFINNACCTRTKEIKLKIPRLPIPIIGWVLDKILSPVNFLVDKTVGAALRKVNEFTLEVILGVDDSNFKCKEGKPLVKGNTCSCVDTQTPNIAKLCLNVNTKERSSCLSCVKNGRGIWTGMGCFYTDVSALITQNIFGTLLGLAGIVSFLCIIYSAFLLQTSRGNPERIKKAREYLTNCILGLILIIFSLFILRIVGVNILGIPLDRKF